MGPWGPSVRLKHQRLLLRWRVYWYCSIILGLEKVMEVSESGSIHSSIRPRSSKAVMVCSSCADGSGPLWLDTEGKPTLGYSFFQWPGCRQARHRLVGYLVMRWLRDQCPHPRLKHVLSRVDLDLASVGWDMAVIPCYFCRDAVGFRAAAKTVAWSVAF